MRTSGNKTIKKKYKIIIHKKKKKEKYVPFVNRAGTGGSIIRACSFNRSYLFRAAKRRAVSVTVTCTNQTGEKSINQITIVVYVIALNAYCIDSRFSVAIKRERSARVVRRTYGHASVG